MSTTFVPSSPESDQPAATAASRFVGKYPFDDLPIGQSFLVPLAEANIRSLRQLVRRNNKDGKRFVLVVHKNHNVVEIARKEPLPIVPEPMPAWAIIPATAVDAQQTPTAFAPPGPSWEAPRPLPAEHPTAESLGWGAPQ